MALSLGIPTISQYNDATTLVVTDTTGVYNASTNTGGWGSPNPLYTALGDSTKHLNIDIVVTDSDGTETTYDTIDVSEAFTSWDDDHAYEITADMLESSGTAMGVSGDKITDGFYSIVLSYVDDSTPANNSTADTAYYLVVGSVKITTYAALADVPFINDFKRFSNAFKEWNDILYPIYFYSLLNGLEIDSNVSKKTQLITGLKALQTLLSSYE